MKSIQHHYRQLAFVQVLLGLLAFCIAEGRPALMGIVGALAVVSWFVTEGPNQRGLERGLLNLGAMGAVLLVTAETLLSRAAQPVVLVGHFMMALQIVLLFAKKTRREEIQLALLSPLQVISASVLGGGVSLVFGLMLLVYCFVTLFAALAFQLKSAGELVYRQHRKAAGGSHTPKRPEQITGPRVRLHFRASALFIGLGCLLIAATAFLTIPRTPQDPFAASLLGVSTATAPQTAGFNDRITLRGGSIGGGSPAPVMNLRLTEGGYDIGSKDKSWLVRGAVQDTYNPQTRTWSRPPLSGAQDLTLKMPNSGLRLAPGDTGSREAQITLRRRSVHHLFTVVSIGGPIAPVYLSTPGLQRVNFSTKDQQIDSNDSLASVLRYNVRWRFERYTDLRTAYHDQLDGLDLHQRYGGMNDWPRGRRFRQETWDDPDPTLHWPVEPERVRAYAERLLRARGLPPAYEDATPQERMEAAEALAEHLRRAYRYTVDNPRANEQDPVIDFLFQTRAGHCELFASGLAALCRSVGIPARLATGYRASEFNSFGGYYVVRQSHAHAWTEVDLGPGGGWHAFDATPPAQVDQLHHANTGLLGEARALYDHLEFNWIATVITYDRSNQQELLGSFGAFLDRGPDQWFADAAGWLSGKAKTVALDTLGRALGIVILLVLLLAVISLARLLLVRHRRMVALQLTALPRGQRRSLARQLRFYIRMLETLERHGRTRQHWQSPFQFARQLADEQPLRYEPVLPLTEMFYEVRFGYRDLDEDRLSRVRLHLRRLEQNLASASRL